jgi:membrane associated rhomboid family serine protease
MGIYDRDYVRREGPSFLGSFAERGRVCKWLIGINVLVFIVQILTSPTGPFPDIPFTKTFEVDVPHVLHGQVWRLLTYAFLHDTNVILHIVFNMLFLWWFGSDVEDLYGPREFLAFYLTASFAGGVAYFLSSWLWMPTSDACLGASGGVFAVMTLFVFHYPQRTIYLFFILPIPLWLFLVVCLGGDAFFFLNRANSETAVAAHLGGAFFGGLYYRMHWRLIDWVPRFHQWRRQLTRPRLRVYREEPVRTPVSVPAAPAVVDEEQLEAKLDAILEKISRVGKENLTESERQVLIRASEVIRRRRS